MPETYYLSPSIPKSMKKLNSLVGWEGEMVQLLLGDKNNKLEEARKILQGQEATGKAAYIDPGDLSDSILNMLPKYSRTRAKIFLHHVKKFLKENEDGLTVLPDGSLSSPMIDIVRYYCSPKYVKVPLPVSSDLLEEAFKKFSMPTSAFASGRWPQTILPLNPPENPRTLLDKPQMEIKWTVKR